MSVPKVSFLVPDIGAPSLGAALRMARSIANHFPVQIVGPDMGSGVCSMYRGAFDYTVVSCPRLYRLPDFWWESRRLAEAVNGDVIISLKAYRDTLPLALEEKKRRGAKVVAYLDEWDGAVWNDLTFSRRAFQSLRHAHHPLNDNHFPRVERRLSHSDEIIVTTSFLQRKFGGVIVPLGADCDFFKPQPAEDVRALKRDLGLDGCRIVAFGGVARPHKGLDSMLEGLVALQDDSVRLMIIGPINDYVRYLQADPRFGRMIKIAGAPSDDPDGINRAISRRMPLYLDAADVLAVPLADTSLARSQMPCKVFEAMAMAKPIIASAVSDLPAVLADCGWVVPPSDASATAAALREIWSNLPEAARRGKKGRERAIKYFSLKEMERLLVDIVQRVAGS